MANYFKITQIRKNDIFDIFSHKSILCTPGTGIHDGKVLKKMGKLEYIVTHIGFYGPIIDLMIRSTVNHLVITEFSKDVRAVTAIDNGDLFLLMKKFFSENDELWNAIKNWFKYNKAIEDYEVGFRNFRCEILNAQLSTILLRPQNRVSRLPTR